MSVQGDKALMRQGRAAYGQHPAVGAGALGVVGAKAARACTRSATCASMSPGRIRRARRCADKRLKRHAGHRQRFGKIQQAQNDRFHATMRSSWSNTVRPGSSKSSPACTISRNSRSVSGLVSKLADGLWWMRKPSSVRRACGGICLVFKINSVVFNHKMSCWPHPHGQCGVCALQKPFNTAVISRTWRPQSVL